MMVFLACSKIVAPEDIQPPETPANFSLLGGGDGEARFRWAKNVEPDFDQFRLYRAVHAAALFRMVASISENEYADRFLSYDSTYYYYLTAVDFAGNESKPTNVIDIRPINISSPPSPENIVVNGHNYPNLKITECVVSWIPPGISDLFKFKIYRGNSDEFPADNSTFLDTSLVSIYYDRRVSPGTRYYYRIVCVDRGGLESIPSLPGNDRILETVEQNGPANRVVVSPPFSFSWSPVDSAAGYRVFVALAPLSNVIWSSSFTKTGTVEFNNRNLASNRIYYWWVGAYSKNPEPIAPGADTTVELNSRSEVWSFFVQ